MLDHDRYRKLAALAAIGQISSKEEIELLQHLSRCLECQQMQSDYRFIVSRQVALHSAHPSGPEPPPSRPPLSSRLRDSFLARARAEGIHFSRASERTCLESVVALRYKFRSRGRKGVS